MKTYTSNTLVVKNPLIKEALDLSTGAIQTVWEVVGNDYEKVLQKRLALKTCNETGNPILACPLCLVPLHLVSLSKKRLFYFRHEEENGQCPFHTKGRLNEEQILALKYDGVRESAAHKRMKDIIASSLSCDPDFSNIEIEAVWKGQSRKGYRKPDVRAIWKGSLPIAFEVQLSTTFLRVIAARREFYLREGGLLVWIFNSFDMGNARLTQEDVFYNNNRNAFIANEETLSASRTLGKFSLDCVWSAPSDEGGILTWEECTRRVQFNELTVEQNKQRVFFFDADKERERFNSPLEHRLLRRDFRQYWFSDHKDRTEWLRLRTQFARMRIYLPEYLGDAESLHRLIDSLYSAEIGKPCAGWRFTNIVQLAHHIHEHYKGYLWVFRLMLQAHKQEESIRKYDTTGKWREKVKKYKQSWIEGKADYTPDRQHDALISFLFPEIAAELPKSPIRSGN